MVATKAELLAALSTQPAGTAVRFLLAPEESAPPPQTLNPMAPPPKAGAAPVGASAICRDCGSRYDNGVVSASGTVLLGPEGFCASCGSGPKSQIALRVEQLPLCPPDCVVPLSVTGLRADRHRRTTPAREAEPAAAAAAAVLDYDGAELALPAGLPGGNGSVMAGDVEYSAVVLSRGGAPRLGRRRSLEADWWVIEPGGCTASVAIPIATC